MTKRKYSAFISYSHSDEAFANRLHKYLERWRTPRQLVGRPNRDGQVPKRLFPVFRDRNELPTSADLGAVIREGLVNSRYLIVLCSPRAAKSRWVNEEVLEFKRIHGEGRVIAAILEGDPAESFPPALLFEIGEDGELTDRPVEPVAADFRPGKDGRQNGRLKLVSGLLGVNFDDIFQREKRRRATRINIGIVCLGALGVAMALGFSQIVTAFFVSEDKRAMRSAISTLNTGGFFYGAEAVLRGDPHRERWEREEHLDLELALRARLVPLEDVVRTVDIGELRRWRESTLLRLPGTMTELPPADFTARVGDVGMLMTSGSDIQAFSLESGDPLWTTTLDGNEKLCNIWQGTDANALLAEGYTIGVNGNRSYGFAAYLDAETGDLQRIQGEFAIGTDVCTDKTEQGLVDATLERISRPLPEFQWPQQRPERSLWKRASTPARAPLVPESDAAQILDRIQINESERASAQVAVCEAQTIVAFETDDGFGMCHGSGDLTCTRVTPEHEIDGVSISPDCGMSVAWGATRADGPGVSIIRSDGNPGVVAQAVSARSLALGTFSPNGQYFAARHEQDTLLVFEVSLSGLVLTQTYEFSRPLTALTFVGNDTLVALRSDGRLYTLDRETGEDMRPYSNLAPDVAHLTETAQASNSPAKVHLVADPTGRYFALLVQTDAHSAATIDPHLSSTDADVVRYARVFDNRLGVAFGGRLLINELYAEDATENALTSARLDVTADGTLYFTAGEGQTLQLTQGEPSDAYARSLTGISFGDALTALPSIWLRDN